MLYTGSTLYEQLLHANISSYMYILRDYANTVYSQSVHRGSTLVPFSDGEDMLHQLLNVLRKDDGPAYHFVYWGKIDSMAHEFGPGSPKHKEAIIEFNNLVSRSFLDQTNPDLSQDTLVLLSADHGHSNIKHEDIINLNRYPEIDHALAKGKNGKHILPTGSPHDVFLFIMPEKVDTIISFLRKELAGKADVLTIIEALDRGMFGINQPKKKFFDRIGNVLILPHPGYHVWYEFFPEIPYEQLGIHGGMSEEEMIVPFAIAPLSELID